MDQQEDFDFDAPPPIPPAAIAHIRANRNAIGRCPVCCANIKDRKVTVWTDLIEALYHGIGDFPQLKQLLTADGLYDHEKDFIDGSSEAA